MEHRPKVARVVAVALLGTSVVAVLALTAFSQKGGERISARYSPGPQPMVTITNNHSSPITGMLIENRIESPDGHRVVRQVFRYDPTTHDPAYRQITTGQTHTFNLGQSRDAGSAALNPTVKAVIFADGTSFGDPDWVDELRAARQCSFNELGVIEGILNDAIEQGLDTTSVISLLKQRQESVKVSFPGNGKTKTSECRAAAHFVYHGPLSTLERGGGGTQVLDADVEAVIRGQIRVIGEEREKLAAVGVAAQVDRTAGKN